MANRVAHEPFHFKSRAALEQKIADLGLDMPLSDDVSILFSPLSVASRTLPNRLAVLPLEGADADSSGAPSDLTFRRYRRFAEGGCALIWFEATAVAAAGRSNPQQLWISRASKGGFARLVEETRRAARQKYGSGSELFLILQLTHGGRFSKPEGKPAPVISRHDPVLDALAGLPPDYPLITDSGLDALQEDYVAAAELAAGAGFDGVDIKACHGYLVSELLGGFARADSRYGGSLENRARFLLETAAKIRTAAPGLAVTSRLNVFDALPSPQAFGGAPDDPGRPDLSEPIDLIGKLKSGGSPLLGLSLGIPAFRSHYGRPYDKPLLEQDLPDEHPLVGVSRWLSLTAEVQREFPGFPLLGGGYSWLRHFFPLAAAAMVESGKATLVGLGRGALALPGWASELAETGLLNPGRVCITCSKCSQLLRGGGPVGCPVRDRETYAEEYRRVRKRAREAWKTNRRARRAEKRKARRTAPR
jgi:2,4-dienoyl-CoA reductase-like NADH-dependent reductase (Old Yellow Enzyme family)